jgi:uncharacterized protein YndB with AHSA1/START domain
VTPQPNARSRPTREVTITRVFDAPREVVFRAWTDARQLARWWGPKGFKNPVCEIDARPGGALRIVMRAPDGVEHPMRGVIQEIVPPERLVFTAVATDADDGPILEGLTTVTFVEHKGRTILTLRASAVAVVDHAAAHLNGMEVGWTQSIDRLAAEVAAG